MLPWYFGFIFRPVSLFVVATQLQTFFVGFFRSGLAIIIMIFTLRGSVAKADRSSSAVLVMLYIQFCRNKGLGTSSALQA